MTSYNEVCLPQEQRVHGPGLRIIVIDSDPKFAMRHQKKRHNYKQDSHGKRKVSRGKETVEYELRENGDTRVDNDNCVNYGRISSGNTENTSTNQAEHQQRLSWTTCKRCRRKRVSSEEKKPVSGYCKQFTNALRLKMVRVVGHCLLLLLFASCGAVIINRVLTGVNNQFAAQLLNSDIYKEVQLRPVSLKDFRRQLPETRSYHDLLRIFFDRKSISDEEIDELLTARTLKRIPGHVHLREVASSEDYSEETYQDYDYALQDPGSSVVEDLNRAYDHIDEMELSPLGQCKYPQPEIMPVRGEGDSKHKLYIPECTIVHRCRNVSGCCPNSSHTCGPKSIEVISKSFFVMEIMRPDLVQPDKVQMVETRDFINHTECECQEIKGLPGCDRECPLPFTRTRPDFKCVCDCLDDHYGCLDIKRGIKPLEEEMLMCIKQEKCLEPECEVDQFDIKSGYCPHAIFSLHHQGKKRRKSHRHKSKSHNSRHHHKGKNHRHKEKQKTSS